MLRVDVPVDAKLSSFDKSLLERAGDLVEHGVDLGADTLDGDDDEHRNQGSRSAHTPIAVTPESSLTNFSIDLNIDCSL